MGSDVEMHRLVAGSNRGVACSCGWFGPGSDHEAHAVDAIAQALAQERATVQARFLRLAQELDTDNNEPGFEASPDYWAGLSEAADRIRRVAEEG